MVIMKQHMLQNNNTMSRKVIVAGCVRTTESIEWLEKVSIWHIVEKFVDEGSS